MTRLGVSYFGNRFINHAREDLRRISESCDYVVHTVSEPDLIFHKSVLSKIFQETKKIGLEVWVDPWGLGGVFGGEAFSKFILEHRGAWQVMSDGRFVPAACINNSAFRSFVKEWVLNVRDMGAEVIFWDEPHIAFDIDSEIEGIFSCACSTCKALFKKEFGEDLPAKLNENARIFRRKMVRSFLSEIMDFCHENKLRNAICLYAFRGIKDYDWFWEEAAGLKSLDILGCDPYWRWHWNRDPRVHVKEFSRFVFEMARRNGKESQVWIQAMRLPAGSEGEIEQACNVAVNEGVSHLAAWSFDGGELLDPVLSERPGEVWNSVERAFKKLKGKG